MLNDANPAESPLRLSELQFQILNATMDDAEDLEQIYLAINPGVIESGTLQPQYSLRSVVDELDSLLNKGYLEAPLFCNPSLPQPPDRSRIHHYWFALTDEGK